MLVEDYPWLDFLGLKFQRHLQEGRDFELQGRREGRTQPPPL